MGDPSPTAKYFAEALGTFALVFAVGCNVLGGTGTFAVISIASTLMVFIYALGGISGGHFNPAVSVAAALSTDFGWDQAGIYSVFQMLGGTAGAASYAALFGRTFNLAPAAGYSAFDACAAELFYTFMLTFVVLNVACARKSQPNEYFGLAIAFTVVAGGYGAGKISGGCFNPAVAWSVDIISAGWGFGYCGLYILAELCAAALAAGLYRVVHPEEFGGSSGESMTAKLASEFLGTFFLIMTVGLNVAKNASPAAVFSIASSLMCMIYALGNVSGGHFNPAVTVAILLSGRNKTNAGEAASYIATQLLAGALAGLTFGAMMGGVAITNDAGHSWGSIVTAEIIFTFVLAYVVLCVATTRSALAQFFALAIGFCVIVGGYSIGSISGGHLNPAVSMGVDVSGAAYKGAGFWKMAPYAAAQLTGGAIAAGVFSVTHATEFGKSRTADLEYGTA